MSAAKRAASQPSASSSGGGPDILSDPRVLRHELRHVKIRLREALALRDELSQLNAEHAKEIQQQRVYCKRMEEQWAAMEDGMRALAAAVQLQIPAASEVASAASSSSGASALSSAPNPVLRMLSSRWSALTGKTFVPAQAAATAGEPAAKSDDNAMDEGEPEDDDEDEAGRKGAAQDSKLVALDEALQSSLQQRAAFAQSVLSQLVQQLPSAASASSATPSAVVASSDPAAQLLSLQADRLSLQQRLHASENEVALLSATLAERDALVEKEREKNKGLLRRVERMQVDIESGNVAAVAASTAAGAQSSSEGTAAPAASSGGAGAADALMLDVAAPDTRPLSPTSLSRLSTVTPAAAAAFAGRWSERDVLQLKEQLVEVRKLAKTRLEDLLAARQDYGRLEVDMRKAKMNALQDEAAVTATRPYVVLNKQAQQLRADRDRIRMQLDAQTAEREQLEKQVAALQTEMKTQLAQAQTRGEAAARESELTIASLSEQVQTLQSANVDLTQALPKHPDFAYYTHLREHVLPGLESAVKAQAAEIERQKEERRLAKEVTAAAAATGAAAPVADEALLKQVARVMRRWKDQERKLTAEKVALSEELETLRKAPSGALSGSASAAELSQLRASLSAVQKELAAVSADLKALQDTPGDVADLRAQLDTQMELAAGLGEELNSVSEVADNAQQRLVQLGSTATEGTKVLDKLRTERAQTQRQQNAWRSEQTALRTNVTTLEQTIATQNRALRDLRAEIDSLRHDAQLSRDTEAALTAAADAARTQAQQAALDMQDSKAKMMQIVNKHDACGDVIEALEKKQREADATAQRHHEADKLLRARIVKLQEASGSGSGRRKESDESADAARIRQLQLRLNCKVCETRAKNTVISKCMHAFCKECVQNNLDTRLRKCPTCGVKFGDSDVRPLYL